MKNQHNQEQELYQLEDELKEAFSSYVVKAPSSQDTKNLLATLQPAFDQINFHTVEEFKHESVQRPSFLSQLKAQVSFYQWHFWVASTFIFVMLTLLTSNRQFSDATVFFQITIPLSVLVGVFYTYQTWNKQMRTIESITPFPPALLLLSRMMIIFAMNIILGIKSSVYLHFTTISHFELFPFLLHWIAPCMLIYGLIAYMMMRKGVKFGLGIGITAWVGFMAAGSIYQGFYYRFFTLQSQDIVAIQGAFIITGILLLYMSYKKSLSIQTMFR